MEAQRTIPVCLYVPCRSSYSGKERDDDALKRPCPFTLTEADVPQVQQLAVLFVHEGIGRNDGESTWVYCSGVGTISVQINSIR